jgi:glycogen(starch) synthase
MAPSNHMMVFFKAIHHVALGLPTVLILRHLLALRTKETMNKTKIMFLSAAYPPDHGGVATHVANLAHGLLNKYYDNQYEIRVLASPVGIGMRNYEINGPIRVIKVPVEYTPGFSGRRVPPDTLVMEKAFEICRDFNPDIIHAHDYDSISIGSILKAVFLKPLIATIHRAPIEWRDHIYEEDTKSGYLMAISAYKYADAIVVPSHTSYKCLVNYNFENISVIPHGIRVKYLASFSVKSTLLEKLGVPRECRVVFCPARADMHKDPEAFIDAAPEIIKRVRENDLIFILACNPSGDDYIKLRERAIHNGLITETPDRNIIFHQFEYKDMPTIYKRASLCVIPSRRESFGQVALESFVFKTPVVAANVGALNEIIVNRENGLLFTAGDHLSLAKQASSILNDKVFAQKLGVAALSSLGNYDSDVMTSRYAELYRSLQNKKGRLPRPPAF